MENEFNYFHSIYLPLFGFHLTCGKLSHRSAQSKADTSARARALSRLNKRKPSSQRLHAHTDKSTAESALDFSMDMCIKHRIKTQIMWSCLLAIPSLGSRSPVPRKKPLNMYTRLLFGRVYRFVLVHVHPVHAKLGAPAPHLNSSMGST